MDYEIKVTVKIDTEAKKNTVRDTIKAQLISAVSAGNVTAWTMDIKGIINELEDYEAYTG